MRPTDKWGHSPITAARAAEAPIAPRTSAQRSREPAWPRTPRAARLTNPEASPLQEGARAALRYTEVHFPSSDFGVVHAERRRNDAYPGWSAETANRVSALIAAGKPARELFELARQARRDFARDVEKASEADVEGYGGSRRDISPYPYGEDYIGITSTNLRGASASIRVEHDLAGQKPFWRLVAENPDRTAIADEALALAMDHGPRMQRSERKVLIVDRHYETLGGEVVKVASTQFDQARPGDDSSPYLVRTWNAPKPEIEAVIRDVHNRIDRALASRSERELVIAMYGFFNAMPYYRGTAAIGRLVFGAVLSEIAGFPVTLSPSIDVQAIIRTLPQFVRSYEAAGILRRQ